ncbi:MAG: hypothetical protein AABZ47_08865 [Planctomycetota bacterium]
MKTVKKCVLALILLIQVSVCQADVFRDLALGLGAAGFDLQGQQNYLSGGIDFLTTNTFTGEQLDLGTTDLTLNGPLSFSVSTGGRGLSELELSFRTAVNSTSGASPLQYVLNSDVGNQSAQINGSLLLDGRMTFNGFGFYDLDMQYSSRQTITQDGVFAKGTTQSDQDVGPINISGNIYVDILATITDPLFVRAGTVNIFSQFSGRDQLQKALADDLESAGPDVALTQLTTNPAVERAITSSLSQLFPNFGDQTAFADSGIRVVPEPAVLLLMLLGAPLVLHRSLKGRRWLRS